MLREALTGAAAGAVGTVALNAVTYTDIVINGRPESSVPATIAGALGEKVGFDLSAEGRTPMARRRRTARAGWARSWVTLPGLASARPTA